MFDRILRHGNQRTQNVAYVVSFVRFTGCVRLAPGVAERLIETASRKKSQENRQEVSTRTPLSNENEGVYREGETGGGVYPVCACDCSEGR